MAVAVTVAIVETVRARRARKETEEVKASQAAEKRREAAVCISGWIEEKYLPDKEGAVYIRYATAHLFNSGAEPVSNVSASVGVGWPTRSLGPLSIPAPLSLPPQRELQWDLTIPLLAHDDTQSPMLEVQFTDPNGLRWHRKFDGTLSEITNEKSKLFDSSDEAAAHAQIGRVNPMNPMAITLAFVQAMTSNPRERAVVDSFLAPEAAAWKSTPEEELDAIAEELNRYGLALFVHYRAPHVAYVKFVTPDHENLQVAFGSVVIEDARFITLTFVRERGWRVFSYGGALSDPDKILFPPGALTNETGVAPIPHGLQRSRSREQRWSWRNKT
ncbi:hypothetical protein ND486_25500 [Pseudonocardia sp. DR1-2]|uniref:hypothetical protein n=1 Tax=Pseudonocardia sp. DR1-2 TaxID=2951168 RepID=UPI0020447E6C|nr:hypothetical protein [Pseudonocardia sp. DR1-2]MCM3849555.1 hypothetical protein [Pseudonocardia sp. DR1-2]